jgi:hypothetical protein
LERKALLYDKIKCVGGGTGEKSLELTRWGADRKGKTGGLKEAQIDNLLVDFDRKKCDAHTDSDESDEDEDESETVPVAEQVRLASRRSFPSFDN